MNVKANWNPQSKIDTVAFSVLILTAAILAWHAAAVPIAGTNAAPQMSRAVVHPVDQTNGSRIVITARRLTKING